MKPSLRRYLLLPILFTVLWLSALPQAGRAQSTLELLRLSTYETGIFAEGAAEIVAYDSGSERLFFVNADANSLVILDIADPSAPAEVAEVDLSTFGGSANAVVAQGGVVAVGVENETVGVAGNIVLLDTDGALIKSVTAGFLPDGLAFSPDGNYVVSANEGEPDDDYTVDPEGTITIVDLSGGAAAATATTIGFTDFNVGGSREGDLPAGVRIFGPGATVAQDLEPEFVTISSSNVAYVTLQENNAVAIVDLATETITGIAALGTKDHSQAGNELDASDRDDAINIANWPVYGMYNPDAIAWFETGGSAYVITANEGDSRDYDGYSEEARVKDLTLDPTAFPDAAALQADEQIGRLNVTTANGDVDSDGDFDALWSFGARSFTIWDASGALVFDSGSMIEEKIAELLPDDFNSDDEENDTFDNRSDNKGPEPEAVAIGTIGSTVYAFVGLERVGGVMVFDVTVPTAPTYVTYVNRRDFSVEFDPDTITEEQLAAVGDLSPEGLIFIPASDSPNGMDLVVASHEVSGTVTIYAAANVIAAESIADARMLADDTVVLTEGIVTRARGRLVRIQDDSGALATFQSSGALRDAVDSGTVREGDWIRVAGEVSPFGGLFELGSIFYFEVLSRDNPLPTPQHVTLAELATNGEDYESELLLVTGLTIDAGGDTEFQTNTNYPLTDASEGTGAVTISTFGGSDIDIAGQPIPTTPFIFRGVLGEFNGNYQLVPVNASDVKSTLQLTLLHNNDGESQLLNLGGDLTDFGGAARFKSKVDSLRSAAAGAGSPSLMLSSGDNYLAGPEFNASIEAGAPYYDTKAVDIIGYDALAIGNHEFDFGPDVLATFISGFSLTSPKFVTANLNFENEAGLQALVDDETIVKRTIIEKDGYRFGIVGATTPNLDFISSPRDVEIYDDVAVRVQAEVDALTADGVNMIIMISHLQGIEEDIELAAELTDIDVMIAGGGDELLANPGDVLLPGDEGTEYGAYPIVAKDAEDNDVYVVTTTGNYGYVGQLVLDFDGGGVVTSVGTESGPKRVAGGSEADAVPENALMVAEVTDPVAAAVASLAANIIGSTNVPLNGVRADVRSKETNEGNLIADALLWQAGELASGFGIDAPDVAIQNGGGIRNDNVLPVGDISELTTFDVLPFGNLLSVIPDIPATQFKEIMENAVSALGGGSGTGRFAQVSGFTFSYSEDGTPQELDDDGNVTTPGTRVMSITLDDGTPIVENGAVVGGAPAISIATGDFLARGGDQYPYRGAAFTILGVSDQQALRNYIETGLSGAVTATQYPEGGEGRILDVTGVSNEVLPESITEYTLEPSYPNPFSVSTTIRFGLPTAGEATVSLYDVTGRVVARISQGELPAGWHDVTFQPNGLASGVYFVRLQAGGKSMTSKMLYRK